MAFDSGAVDDVPVKDVWEALQGDPKAVLIDVRTRSEWAFVGMPDLSGLGSKPYSRSTPKTISRIVLVSAFVAGRSFVAMRAGL